MNETIHLVTVGPARETPDEFHAYETREAALEWIEEQGVDTDELEQYTMPGGEHESVHTGEYPAPVYRLRELEVSE